MSRWALIPVKSFDRGKSRLAEVLPPNERAAFSRKLFEHVVRVLQKSASIDGVAIVSDSTEAREQAEHLGAVALEDVEGSQGLAEVVDGERARRRQGPPRGWYAPAAPPVQATAGCGRPAAAVQCPRGPVRCRRRSCRSE